MAFECSGGASSIHFQILVFLTATGPLFSVLPAARPVSAVIEVIYYFISLLFAFGHLVNLKRYRED
jgi:hypothetical protein